MTISYNELVACSYILNFFLELKDAYINLKLSKLFFKTKYTLNLNINLSFFFYFQIKSVLKILLQDSLKTPLSWLKVILSTRTTLEGVLEL